MHHAGYRVIHPSAIIHPAARLGERVVVGPYSVIGEHVEVGAGTEIGPHVVIDGHTRIGQDNRIHPFCSLGGPPQDKKYAGEPTRLEIGDRNVIREYTFFNTGTAQDGGCTRLGNDNWVMAYVHLAHDCHVGDWNIFANNAQLAGHVKVGNRVVLGGFTVVHQFVQIGSHSLTAMGTILLQDLPPFVTAAGNFAEPHGINTEGLKRAGYTADDLRLIRRAYKTIYKNGLTLNEAIEQIRQDVATCPPLHVLLEFLEQSSRGIIR